MVRDARRGQGFGSGRDLNGRAASVSAMRSYRAAPVSALESYRDLSGLDGSECPSRLGFGSGRDLNAIRAAPVSALLMWARVQTANPDKFTTQVVTQLTAFWPSLTSRDPKEMWREAWKTYGTCLVTPKLKGPTQYFNRAIRLSDEIGNLLEKHLIQSDGIVPCDSATYTNVEILNSLKTVTTVNNQNEKEVSFTCADINATHAYLNQVTFCYNKDAKDFEDCPTSNRCRVENIIVPRPSPPTTRPSSLQTLQTGEKLQQII
ncbi:putative ribonuclease 3-like [Capsicum annuum]|nr:putative ribonuclease 3-like [Capsicum annuum]